MPEKRMAVLAVAFACGVAAAHYASVTVFVLTTFLGLILCLALCALTPESAVVVVGLFVLGFIRCYSASVINTDDISQYVGHVTSFEGHLVTDPEAHDGRISFVVRASRAQTENLTRKVSGLVIVTVYHPNRATRKLRYGNRVAIQATPYIAREPTNPALFSWRNYLARQGIHSCASIRKRNGVRILGGKSGSIIYHAAADVRNLIETSIHKTHPKREAGVVAGMLLGTYSYLPREAFIDFSRTGTLHILAASGYNCFIILAIAMPLLRLMGILPRWRNVTVIGLILFYLAVIGPKPSLVRAAVMSSLLLLALPLKRVANVKNVFYAAALISLLINPLDLFNAGFQLSYLSVLALVMISPVLQSLAMRTGLIALSTPEVNHARRRYTRKTYGLLLEAAVGTTAISLVTWPVVAYHFNYISLAALPANMVMALAVPVVFGASALSAALSFVPWLGQLVALVSTWSAKLVLATAAHLGVLRWASISVESPNPLAIVGYYVILFAIMNYAKSRLSPE